MPDLITESGSQANRLGIVWPGTVLIALFCVLTFTAAKSLARIGRPHGASANDVVLTGSDVESSSIPPGAFYQCALCDSGLCGLVQPRP